MIRINFQYYVPGLLITVVVKVAFLFLLMQNWVQTNLGISISVSSLPLLLLFVIDQKLWHVTPFKFLLRTTDMRGVYEGEIEFKNANGELKKMECKLTIRQTGSYVSVESQFYKPDRSLSSPSRSDTANIIKRDDKSYQLVFTYINEGSGIDDLLTHRGTNNLDFQMDKDGKKILTGHYYNNRPNKGKLTATTKTNN